MKWTEMSRHWTEIDVGARADRAVEGLEQLAVHEAASLDRTLLALRERWHVARRARSAGELMRDQFDLIPASAARIAGDHRQRRRLLRELGDALALRSAKVRG